ncbi:MAG: Flp pilus assembly complex ATPase component TadA [Desulfobacteraceae bacterium]|nr:Flp pilus assembly complex ATPase component TadA [Desulfobacteraceae bacterium]
MSKLASLFLGASSDNTVNSPADAGRDRDVFYHLLFVDDEDNVLKSMRRIFRRENYELHFASSAAKALEILKRHPINVVISDHRMPGMTGTDLLTKVKSLYPETIRIMLTGYADVDAVMGAVNEGAVYKFITKPWNDHDLRLTVSLALEQYDLIQENRSLKHQTADQKKQINRLNGFINTHRSQLGRLLVKEGIITESQLEKALLVQSRTNEILPKVLVELGFCDEKTIIDFIRDEHHIDRVYPNEFNVTEALASLVPREICSKNKIIPLKKTDGTLIVAMADPTDIMKLDDLKFIVGLPIRPVLARASEISEKLDEIFGEADKLEATLSEVELIDPTEHIEILLDDDEETDVEELLAAKDRPPAIRIVNAIISDALRHGASDVHIEPKNKYIMVRYRIDDLLQDKLHIPVSMHMMIVSRIKIMSDLDISERRRPQDGRITVKTSSRIVDMRISTLPTINGEKIVLRVLDKNSSIKDIEDLGFSPKDLSKVSMFIDQPQGILLATGPTGSGKTTTLYSLLRRGAKITKNFTTIEDPVEYYMNMAEQVNIKEKIGLNFSNVLRSILRQDPNVIMLGEIRDHETAEVAFHAAMTGHLVLSTLHTNSSISSITRLRDMGLKSYVISDCLIGIIAQRLVRRICRHCVVDDHPSEELMRKLKIIDRKVLAPKKGAGCENCHQTGYSGRIGVYEVLQVDAEIKRMIHMGVTEPELLRSARLTGMTVLLEDALDKVGSGQTTCEEVLRVFGPQNTVEIECSACNKVLVERFRFCPYCGESLTRICHGCRNFLAADWRVCPACGITADKPGIEK